MITRTSAKVSDLRDPDRSRFPAQPEGTGRQRKSLSIANNSHWGLRSLRLGDYLIVVLLLLITVGWIAFGVSPSTVGSVADVQVSGKQVVQIKLDHEDYYTISGVLGPVLIAVDGSGVRILDARCPDKLCVRTGAINRAGEWIACVPNGLIIRIEGDTGVDAISPGAAMPRDAR